MNPKQLAIAAFSYQLPNERIAKHPLENRDESKLLLYEDGAITQSVYRDIASHIPAETLLIFNDTKVVEARLLFKKETGGVIEIFCLEPDDRYPDINKAMLEKGEVLWKCLIGGANKWKHGAQLKKEFDSGSGEIVLEALIVARLSDCFLVKLSWAPVELSFAELLHLAGELPLPPYLHRQVEEDDKSRYQTVFAKYEGSVAAPTAGLHFTEAIFEKLAAKNIYRDFVTLHVGAGTFKPVTATTMNEHEMHAEFVDVSATTISNLSQAAGKNIVAVGTTSLRTIESLYWMGVKVWQQPMLEKRDLNIGQWEVYEMSDDVAVADALDALLCWMEKNNLTRLVAKTQILLAPSYTLKIANGLITNFHQPNSTLLLLVASVVKDDWRKIYDYALDHDFRFLSYGDGCLLWAKKEIG